ncbi:MAG: indolepyruvate ferredoxin oxidoreductase subunit alpha [Thermotaleaceae bacterium]|jgi:indolepyruvate ferredoxin oxidoreductase alpha subunit
MKRLMTGNEAIARGAYEAGCKIASAYPGTPSTEILENVSKYNEIYSEWSTNEKVALEVAAGASIAGARALVAMKHVGLNVAADPLFTISYEGVNGGLVIITADEPGMYSSQNEQDNRLYANHAKVVMLEPSDSQECKDFVKLAFDISETFDTPVIIRVTTRVCHSKGIVELNDRIDSPIREYKKDIKKYIMVPAHAQLRHEIMEEDRIPKLKEMSNASSINRIELNDSKIGIISSGICYNHAKDVFGDNVSYLKLGLTWPLPENLIRDFVSKVEKVYIIEETEAYIENFIKAIGINCIGKEIFSVRGEITPSIIKKVLLNQEFKPVYNLDSVLPNRPPALCAGCPHRGIFYTIGRFRNKIDVTTDIGCYTLGMAPPLSVGDTLICMGAGISAGIGFNKVNELAERDKKVFGIVGDSTFFHSGITGLVDAVYNKSNMVHVILDNRITAMTGHQENPGTGRNIKGIESPSIDLEALIKSIGVKEDNIRVIDPYDMDANKEAVKDALKAEESFVIITKQPCALLKDVMKARKGMHCEVNQEKCKRCKTCIRVGCPAISFRDDFIHIDTAQCNGCTVCLQVCPFNAIEEGKRC